MEKTVGRPALEHGEKRDKRVQCMVTPDERDQVNEAAKLSGLSASNWLREIALRNARRVIAKAKK